MIRTILLALLVMAGGEANGQIPDSIAISFGCLDRGDAEALLKKKAARHRFVASELAELVL